MKETTRSFVSGELQPSLHHRADLDRYTTGLATCRNFIIRAQGGADNRAGLRFIGEVKDSTKKTRLIEFEFNTTQTYVLEFGDQIMRVIKDGAYVETAVPGVIYELATPYLEADLFEINFTQSADIMTLCHRNYTPYDLSRTDHNAWSLDVINFASTVAVPTFVVGSAKTITDVTNANPAVVTSAAHGFSNGDRITITGILDDGFIGTGTLEALLNGNEFIVDNETTNTFELRDVNTIGLDGYQSGGTATFPGGITTEGTGGGTYTKTYRYVVTATDAAGVESLPSVEVSVAVASLSQTYGIKLTWNASTGADFYTIYKDPANGSGLYGYIGDSNETFFSDFNIAPDTSFAPPEESEPINTAGNYPGSVGYYQQRKLFANTDNQPQILHASQTGNFDSMRFSTPARDSDGITFVINSRQVNEIRHIVSIEDLILLTSGQPFRVTEGQDFVLTPSTIGAKPQGKYGCSKVRPAIVDDSVIFVEDKGGKVRDLRYGIENARYTGSDLSIMAEHLFKDVTVVDMTYASDPYGALWCVMSDGSLLGLTYQREHKVWAWHRHDTDGLFESVSSVSEGDSDAVYFVVKRTIDGTDVRYVERLSERYDTDAEDSFYVDSGLSYDGVATTAISGLDHLEGETVVVLADGNVVRDLVVASGAITLPRAASVVHAGLPYVSDLKTLPIDQNQASTQGKKLNVSEVNIALLNSRGGWVGYDEDNLIEIKPRFQSDSYDTIALKTSEVKVAILPDWNSDGQILVRQIDPLPLSILSITPEFDIGN